MVVAQSILDKNGVQVAASAADPVSIEAGKVAKVTQSLAVAAPALWSLEERNLYTMKTTVTVGGVKSDEYLTTFGFRTVEFNPSKGFHLNGKHVKLKGVAEHHDLGALGAAMNFRALERKMQILKAMGVNCIRTAHNPPAPEMMQLADELGFLIINEAFDIWGGASKSTSDYARFWTVVSRDGRQWHEGPTRT